MLGFRTLLIPATLTLAGLSLGCATLPNDAASPVSVEATDAVSKTGAARASKELPEYLMRLGVTVEQRAQLDAIRDRLLAKLQMADAQRLNFEDAVIDAIASCDPAFARLHIEGRRMVRAGNDAKPAVLAAINELHAMLTPDQRRKLVEPIISRNVERRGNDGTDGFREVGAELDLSISQILRILKRYRTQMSMTSSDRDELRDMFDEGAKSFLSADFDAHQQGLGKEPIVEHVVRLVLDLGTVVLPVLEKRQCANVSAVARKMLDERRKKRAEAKRAAAK
jgi:Spy/CpxP family protein refolding chaperone